MFFSTGVAYSIAKWSRCFQQCLFVNSITSERSSLGWWNLVARCIVQKYNPSSNLNVIGPTHRSHPKCGILLSHYATRSPAVARDGQPYWPSRKTVIPSGIGLAAVLGVGHLSYLVKLIVHWLTAYCPSTLYRTTLAVINNVYLLVWHEPHQFWPTSTVHMQSYGRRLLQFRT